MTKPIPKIRPTPMSKMGKIAQSIRGNGKVPIARAAIVNGYSFPYFRWNVVPVLVSFFDDIKSDGESIWSDDTIEPENLKEELKKMKEAAPT